MSFCRSTLSIRPKRGATTRATIDAKIRAFERSYTINEGAVARVDVCQLAANAPVEDNFSIARCLSSDASLFGIFDGHGGYTCSRNVSIRLFDYICAAVLKKHVVKEDIPIMERLKWISSSIVHKLPQLFELKHEKNVRAFYQNFQKSSSSFTVRKAIQAAFVALDDDIGNGALPDIKGHFCRQSAAIAASGSCATVAHIRSSNLHVANIGDSAAVMGVLNNGTIVSRQITRFHNPENADEVKRVRQAHPQNERGTILKNGRLLGELIPLRAFGDVQFKWSRDLQKIILAPLGYNVPQNLTTPPYLTALPDVFYHQLTPNDKFLIVCSDGIFDFLDPDTVVRIVNDHCRGRETLTAYKPTNGITLDKVIEELSSRRFGSNKKPIDDNSATHIVRHALGGVTKSLDEQYANLKDQLNHPQGIARNYRDDMTVIVIHFNQQFLTDETDTDAISTDSQ
uniref:PPM-type phosphatase domain-containing protein n=1 Tax=Rhabditophanes sp. KR3021 TaxID=114890 RepID=A0AC35TPK2_9BILA